MTSFPAAIGYATQAVRSLLCGSVLPDKLVLYVTLSQFGDEGLPADLQSLAASNPIFEIRDYPRDIRSYRKLIPALLDFPDATIVTVDDDVWYHRHTLRDLLLWHSRHPRAVVAHRVRVIRPTLPYRRWPKMRWYNFLLHRAQLRFDLLQTGVGGVLYPPHCLRTDMLNPDIFMRLAPTVDDIWFWAAATAAGTPVLPVPFGYAHPRETGKPNSIALKTVNYTGSDDRNAAALRSVLEHYPELKEKLR